MQRRRKQQSGLKKNWGGQFNAGREPSGQLPAFESRWAYAKISWHLGFGADIALCGDFNFRASTEITGLPTLLD
jgi:hypothetical protein